MSAEVTTKPVGVNQFFMAVLLDAAVWQGRKCLPVTPQKDVPLPASSHQQTIKEEETMVEEKTVVESIATAHVRHAWLTPRTQTHEQNPACIRTKV